mgnify:CR=1 FL=1
MDQPETRLVVADTPALVEAAREIFRDYAASLSFDLCFQDFDAELAGLPAPYAAPDGTLLLALIDGEVAGCGALRRLTDVDYPNACEMKRLYVEPAFRGKSVGRALALIDGRLLQASGEVAAEPPLGASEVGRRDGGPAPD